MVALPERVRSVFVRTLVRERTTGMKVVVDCGVVASQLS